MNKTMKQKYTLVKRELVKEKTFRVIIVADSNDADSGRHEFENFRNETEEGYIEIPYCEWGSCIFCNIISII